MASFIHCPLLLLLFSIIIENSPIAYQWAGLFIAMQQAIDVVIFIYCIVSISMDGHMITKKIDKFHCPFATIYGTYHAMHTLAFSNSIYRWH